MGSQMALDNGLECSGSSGRCGYIASVDRRAWTTEERSQGWPLAVRLEATASVRWEQELERDQSELLRGILPWRPHSASDISASPPILEISLPMAGRSGSMLFMLFMRFMAPW